MTTLGKTFLLLTIFSLFVSIYLLQPILMPFLVGMALAYLGDPLVDRLEGLGAGRTTGVFIVFVVFLLMIVGVILVLLPILAKEIAALIQNIPQAVVLLQETTSPFLMANFGIDPFDLNLDELKAKLASNWQQAGGIAGQVLTRVTASSFVLWRWPDSTTNMMSPASSSLMTMSPAAISLRTSASASVCI